MSIFNFYSNAAPEYFH
jgi:hypothetical protein